MTSFTRRLVSCVGLLPCFSGPAHTHAFVVCTVGVVGWQTKAAGTKNYRTWL